MNVQELGVPAQIYTLEKNINELPDIIKLTESKKITFIFPKMHNSMCLLKTKIDEKNNLKLWDRAKRKINPFELVNVYGTNILKSNKNFSQNLTNNFTPLSRAFFKLTEILFSIDLIPEIYINNHGVVANLAEGPGGFIEALYKYRTNNEINDKYYAITLHSKKKNIPGWDQLYRRKNHFLNNKNIELKTGNLYDISNVLNYSKYFKKKKAFLVTCDGGFDYSKDFNGQEINSHKIIYAEIVTALLVQEDGGTLVCKMFDLFTCFSLQLIYLLTLLYENVNIIKPLTSRPANSEKYIVARGFKGSCKQITTSMLKELSNWDNKKNIIMENITLPQEFINEMEKINISLTEYQTKYITETLDYIKNYNSVIKQNNVNNMNNMNTMNTMNTMNNMNLQLKNANLWFDKHNILSNENYKRILRM